MSETLRLLRDSVRGFAGPDLRRIRAVRFTGLGFSRESRQEMCDLGWPGLRVPEEAGGSGLGMAEACALAEELGAALVPEPLIEAALCASVLRGEALDALLAGERLVLPAWQERPDGLAAVGETVVARGRVSGRKLFVPLAAGAQAFLVSGCGGLVLVEAGAAGVRLAVQPTQDGGHVGTLVLEDARGTPVAGSLEAALEEATLETAAMLDAAGDADRRRAAVSRAKAGAAEAALLVTRQAVQLHGAVGYTDEADIGLFLRRAMVLANRYGSSAVHRGRYAMVATEED